jgi:hypothetical protein
LLAPAYATEGRTGAAGAVVGHISHVDGSVTRLHRFTSAYARPTSGELRRDRAEAAFGREGGPDSAQLGLLLEAGDQVHVGMGRAEITLIDGSLLQLDAHTRVVLHAPDRVQVIEGRMFVRSNGPGSLVAEAGGKRLHVAPGSAAEVTTSDNHDLLVRVVDGDARIESSWGSEAVAATQSAFVSGPTGRPFVTRWVASPHDVFHQWADGRVVVLVPPAAFLPYAHPTYRQQAYQRVLTSQRVERRRGGDVTRGDRPADAHRRDSGRRGVQRDGDRRGREQRSGDQRSGDQTRRAERRDRENNSAPRSEPRPAPKPPTVTARGARAGKVVSPR